MAKIQYAFILIFTLVLLQGCSSGINKKKLVGTYKSVGDVDLGIFNKLVPKTGKLAFAKRNTRLNLKINEDGTVEFGHAGLFGGVVNSFLKSGGYNLTMKLEDNIILRQSRFDNQKYTGYMKIIKYDKDYQNLTLKNMNLGESYHFVRTH